MYDGNTHRSRWRLSHTPRNAGLGNGNTLCGGKALEDRKAGQKEIRSGKGSGCALLVHYSRTCEFQLHVPSVCKGNEAGESAVLPKGFSFLTRLSRSSSLSIMWTAKWQPLKKLIKNHFNRVHLFSSRPVFILRSIHQHSKVILTIFALLCGVGTS